MAQAPAVKSSEFAYRAMVDLDIELWLIVLRGMSFVLETAADGHQVMRRAYRRLSTYVGDVDQYGISVTLF